VKKRFLTVLALATVFFTGLNAYAEPANQQTAVSTADDPLHLVVHKSPTCGCCLGWMEHMHNSGFSTTPNHPEALAQLKLNKGVELRYQSCHTAVSQQGYVFEGHVPAKFVRQFLAKAPQNAIGLSVPGMPLGSPGMEVGDKFMPYQVLLLKKDGDHEVFAKVDTAADQF
jgi:hypothetical protein